ncbi:MAG: helix-turn-helix domain-containing protein [Prevotella sp.]|nr:helix-turn-helix domain-containing protein [Prevotella sp.]
MEKNKEITLEMIMQKLEAIEAGNLQQQSGMLNTSQAAVFLGISEDHLARLTGKRKIPFYKNGKYNLFDINDLKTYLRRERIASNEEIESQAETRVALARLEKKYAGRGMRIHTE